MWQRSFVLACVVGLGFSVQDLPVTQSEVESPTQTALRFFMGHGGETIEQFLASYRPVPLEDGSRVRVLVSFPVEIHVVSPSGEMRKKMAVADRVLRYNGRSGVITFKVIADDAAFAALYFRAILLVSTSTLELLTPEELAAVTAHEVGHDFDWTEYWSAVTRRDYPRLRQLELRSDGIAVLTLRAMGLDPDRVASATIKMTRFNELRESRTTVGADSGTGARYVPLKERIAFMRAIAQLKWTNRSLP
jgi:hypothetical protein